MSTKERMEKMRRDMHVFERLSNPDCTWCLERIEALEKVAEAAREVLPVAVAMQPCDQKLADAISALDAKNTPEPTPELIPVYPGPDLKRGDIVYTPSGRRAEVYNIDEDKGTFTSQGQFCASVLRREKPAADAEEK